MYLLNKTLTKNGLCSIDTTGDTTGVDNIPPGILKHEALALCTSYLLEWHTHQIIFTHKSSGDPSVAIDQSLFFVAFL